MYTNILVPLDGSSFAETALPHAEALADKFGSKVTLVKVFETPHLYQSAIDNGILMDVHQAAVKNATDYLESVRANLVAQGLTVDIHFIDGGNVAAMILEAITETKADLLVMSTHGRSGFLEKWRVGSVAQRVSRHATIPIVMIRPK